MTRNKFYFRGGRYRQVSLYDESITLSLSMNLILVVLSPFQRVSSRGVVS